MARDAVAHVLGLAHEAHGSIAAFGGLEVAPLADLIDPTCRLEPMDAYTPSHEFSRWRCERCGAVSFAPRPFLEPRFCPGCGARVVDDE